MPKKMRLPNVIGRLDPVAEAIGEGDLAKTKALLQAEEARLVEAQNALKREVGRRAEQLEAVRAFVRRVEQDPQFWADVQQECAPAAADKGEKRMELDFASAMLGGSLTAAVILLVALIEDRWKRGQKE